MIGFGWALSIGVRFVYPALLPLIRDDLLIDLSTSGLLLSCLWASYAIGHVPGGFLGDRLGEGRTLIVSVIIATAAVLTLAASPLLLLLFGATIGFGLATALYGPTRFTILTDLYPDRAGSAIGMTMAAGSIGNMLFPVLATIVAGAVSWRLGFAVFAPFFAVVAGGLWLVLPRRTSQPGTVSEFSWEMLRQLKAGIRTGAIPTVVAIQTTLSFMIQGFASFYPSYLTQTKGLSPEVAATVFGAFFAAGALIQPTSGRLTDLFGLKKTLVGFFTLCLSAMWLLPFIGGLAPLIIVTLMFSAWNGTIVPTQTYIASTLPEDMQGTGFGILKATWMLLGATAPLMIGIFADAGLFNEAFLVLASVGTVGLTITTVSL